MFKWLSKTDQEYKKLAADKQARSKKHKDFVNERKALFLLALVVIAFLIDDYFLHEELNNTYLFIIFFLIVLAINTTNKIKTIELISFYESRNDGEL